MAQRAGGGGGTRVVRSEYWFSDSELPNCDVVSLLFSRFQRWPNKTAVMCERTNRSYTFQELQDNSLKVGAAILDLAKLPGGAAPACVAVIAPNIPEYPIVVFGALAIGSIVTTPPVTQTPSEMAWQLRESESSVLIVDTSMEDKLLEALKLMDKSDHPSLIVSIGASKQGYPDLLNIINDGTARKVRPVENAGSKTAILPYSSGTTGISKGVCLPHRAISNFLKTFTHPAFYPYGETTQDEPQESCIGLLQFYHGFGLFILVFTTLYLGAKLVCLTDVTPEAFADGIRKHKVRVLHTSPPILNGLAYSPLVTIDHLATVVSVITSTAAVHPTLAKAFKQKAPNAIIQEMLGMTETHTLMFTPKEEERLGYCGRLVPNTEAQIIDVETREALGPDAPGELLVRGPSLLTHYNKNPEATAMALDAEGWFHTGDVAQYTSDGFFKIVDRLKDYIKVDGHQVSPTEVENVILQVPAVAEAAVVGVPNVMHGELPKAFVVLKKKTAELDETALDQIRTDIDNLLAEKVSEHMKLAAGIEFVPELPKNATGKLLRRKLKEQAKL